MASIVSTQTISDEERNAIWHVHDHKCFWRRGLLAFNEMVVDHVVPESLGDLDEPARSAKFSELGLPADYDVQAYYNLVPACHPCNGRKSDRELDPRPIALSLAITRGLVQKIEARIASLVAGRTLAQVMAAVASGLKTNKFTPEQLLEALTASGAIPASVQLIAANAREAAAAMPSADTTSDFLPATIHFASMKGAGDAVSLPGVAKLLASISRGEVDARRVENGNGRDTFVLQGDGLYVKYSVEAETILVESCHLTLG